MGFQQTLRVDGLGRARRTGTSGAVKTMVNGSDGCGEATGTVWSRPGAYALRLDYGRVFESRPDHEPAVIRGCGTEALGAPFESVGGKRPRRR
jgi:hypothetical protein